ncbi:hypothetical protein CHL76_16390 [Marinococcus halophilus]|uniref:Uncharacterized protein n=1 Tax=Marinococcus halophilus TaxID=1371 RepID=A0A510YAB0_MARHA|nr:hypothetical protein [Marinococcus halophilus]OZT78752.1 hypothetical protein CHL76_16390 [Marinococcus halophilus]GEK60299.1 hypothetical protein MHA01_32040 [Marinococcus halophilus]
MAVRKPISGEDQQSAVVIVDNGGIEERINLLVLSIKAIRALAKDSGLKIKATKKQDMVNEILNQAAGSKLTVQNKKPGITEEEPASQKNKENYAGVIITNKEGNEEEVNLYSMEKQAVKKLAVDSGLQVTAENKNGMIEEIMKQVSEAYQGTEKTPAENNNEDPNEHTLPENKAPASSSFLSEATQKTLVHDITRSIALEWKDEMYTEVKEELKQQVKNDVMQNAWEDLVREIKESAGDNSITGEKFLSIKPRADR